MVILALSLLTPLASAQVEVEEYTLDNGMTFLLLPRYEEPNNVAAGWLAHVGSVNEYPGITGISHFFEHMMFKGTTTIGTNDADKDAWYRAEQERVKSQLRDLQNTVQAERARLGEIDDPFDTRNDTPEMQALREELNTLIEDHREVIVKDEFDAVYTSLGASGMNAFTSSDVTFYFITVPSNRIEGWMWMESDRLTDSVFREFYAERDVVHEERRLRVESTPTGVYDEQLEAMFWTSSPYSWPVIGWPSDLNSYTMDQAHRYFRTYYAPNNLTGVIVGDFQIDEVKPLIDQYFSHLRPGPAVPPMVTTEVEQLAERRMTASCDCPNSFAAVYKAPAYGHKDGFVLDVISALLNDRTGRLYKSMVQGEEIATSASAYLDLRKYAGALYVNVEAREGVDPLDIEAAWGREVERLQTELVDERELQKIKNQSAADTYRRLQTNFYLMIQIGYSERLGGWEWLNEEPRRVAEVTPEDIQRVAQAYFNDETRAVAHYVRDASSAPPDPAFLAVTEGLPPEAVSMLRTNLAAIAAETDPNTLKEMRAAMQQQQQQVPAPFRPAMDYLIGSVDERITALEGN
jgi:predicted Zn-dependent peptidase